MAQKGKANKPKKRKTWLTRRFGIWMMIIGLVMQFLNILTYGLWEIDIDILGALIFIIGLVIMLVRWRR